MTIEFGMKLVRSAFVFCLLACLALLDSALSDPNNRSEEGWAYDTRTCRGTSLHPKSTWPSDHGDCSRSKYTIGAGLPKNVKPEDIKRVDNVDVGNAQWIYTGGENAEFIFAIGPQTAVYVAKFDAKTLQLLQKVDLGSCLYLGGAAVHANGHFYMMHTNKLYRFWYGDLYNASVFELPTSFDPLLTQTNGMLVSHDGQLIIKQWPMILRDFEFFFHAKPVMLYALIATVITFVVIRMTNIPDKEKSVVGFVKRLFVSVCFGVFAAIVMLSLILTKLAGGKIDYIRLFTNNYLKGEVGELKFVDPATLTITADIQLPERCSFARMAMTTSRLGEEDRLVLLGDEFVHQVVWNSKTRVLANVPSWSKRYRRTGDGTFPGTGPAVFNNVAYFTDNTFPVALRGRSYSMFSQSLDEYEKPLATVPLTESDSSPGFMFWSITVSPFVGDIFAWDIRGRSVQARRASNMSLHWEVETMNADCLTIAADKNHVYFSDHSAIPGSDVNKFLPWMREAKSVTKYFLIADAETGQILVNTTLSTEDGIRPSMIVPGAHNDVIIGTSSGVSRLYAEV